MARSNLPKITNELCFRRKVSPGILQIFY